MDFKSSKSIDYYINKNEGNFKNVKFFIIAGGSGFDSTSKQMENTLKNHGKL